MPSNNIFRAEELIYVKSYLEINMEDRDLKAYFDKYNPNLSDDSEFIKRTIRNLEAIEAIRQNMNVSKHLNKVAMFWAAFIGFLVGIVLMFVLPFLFPVFDRLLKSIYSGTTFIDSKLIGYFFFTLAIGISAYITFFSVRNKTYKAG